MRCPSCGRPASQGAEECAACGIVFAKWKKREDGRAEDRRRAEAAALAALEAPSARAGLFDPWLGRGIAGAVVAAWLIGFGLYFHHRYGRRPPPGDPTGDYAVMRDQNTGDMRRRPIYRRPGVPVPPRPATQLVETAPSEPPPQEILGSAVPPPPPQRP